MTDEELKPMDKSLSALLSEAQSAERTPDAARSEEVWTRLIGTVGPIVGGAGGGGDAGGDAGGGDLGAGGGALTAKSTIGAAAAKGAGALWATRALVGAAIYASGIVSGVVLQKMRIPDAPREEAHVAAPARPNGDDVPLAPAPLPVEVVEPQMEAPPVVAESRVRPVESHEVAQDSAQERLLLERARSALARGDADSAIAALQRHASTYRRGQLSEERDALLVQAFVNASRYTEARLHATRFHASYPRSLFVGVVDAALRRIPEGS